MAKDLRILLIEDSEDDAILILRAIRRGGYNDAVINRVETEETMRQALLREKFDIILSDYSLPFFDGRQSLELAKELGAGIPFILVSGAIGEETAVELMRAGADDYIMKDKLFRLVPSIERELRETEQRKARQKAEQALRAEQKFTATALNALKDTFFVFEPVSGKAIRWNKTFREITGYSDEEIAELKTPDSYYSINGCKRAAVAVETILEQGTATFELDLITKKGDSIPFEYSASLIESSQKPPCIISIGRDISERKSAEQEKARLESQLRQAQKMEAIGTLAGGIAHDFNNILAAILGYADMARDEMQDRLTAAKYIDQVLKAGDRAKELVKHILAFSRKSIQERAPLEIHLIMKEALKLLRASIPTTIEIRENIVSHCGTIMADPTQIHQVLMNLCTNAAQAMDEKGGVLEVILDCLDLSQSDLENEPHLKPGPYIKLSVKDTGTGIDQAVIDRIFDPYFTTKDVGKGSGMGLAVVHGIVKNHDGMITVESTLGEGTAFHVYFPRIEKKAHVGEKDDKPLPCGDENILVVDDERTMVEMQCRILVKLGYKVTAKTSSIEALELFRTHPNAFDLVITDQTMPHMTGDQLAQELMEIRADIPIILCTGYSSKINAEKARNIGIKHFLMKPIDKKVLARKIREILDEQEVLPPVS